VIFMVSHYTYLALELAKDRMHEAEVRNRRLLDWEGLRSPTPGFARRTLARGAAFVSRGSAAVARRLDSTVVDGDSSLRSSPTA
jgi:hypothetical protein